MSKLEHPDSKIKLEFAERFSIKNYLTETEQGIYTEELCESQNPYLVYVPPRCRSGYSHKGGNKAGNTELRIAGVILNKMRAMLSRLDKGFAECRVTFTKKDIARQVRNELGEGISERTVQRYLRMVLEKMSVVYDLHFEITIGRNGHLSVWTDELEQIEQSNERLFDESLIGKSRSQKTVLKLRLIQKEKETKRATHNYLKAKGESFSKGKMIKLAFGLLKSNELPYLKNFEVSNWDVVNLLVERLKQAEWRQEAWHAVCASLIYTDRAMTEYTICSPLGYARFNLRKREIKVASKAELKKERSRHYQERIDIALEEMKPILERKAFSFAELEKIKGEFTGEEFESHVKGGESFYETELAPFNEKVRFYTENIKALTIVKQCA